MGGDGGRTAREKFVRRREVAVRNHGEEARSMLRSACDARPVLRIQR